MGNPRYANGQLRRRNRARLRGDGRRMRHLSRAFRANSL